MSGSLILEIGAESNNQAGVFAYSFIEEDTQARNEGPVDFLGPGTFSRLCIKYMSDETELSLPEQMQRMLLEFKINFVLRYCGLLLRSIGIITMYALL